MAPRLWCLDENHVQVRWGRAIHSLAVARGWDCQLFTSAREVDEGYAFMRVEQREPGLSRHKAIAETLDVREGVTLIPHIAQVRWYEDKVRQARDLGDWLPETRIVLTMEGAAAAIEALGVPFVSKSAEGSSCVNVRLIRDRDEAMAEARAALHGDGVPMRLGRETARQRGYCLWQRFLAGNNYMYRVGVCGRLKWLFREGNRPGVPFASGSEIYKPVQRLDDETRAVFDAAARFAEATGQRWCGLDYARDPDSGEWMLLETTLAWGMVHPRSTRGCMLLDEHGEPTGRKGDKLWDALLDEIQDGVFGEELSIADNHRVQMGSTSGISVQV